MTGAIDTCPLAKILFVADKLEPSPELEALAARDLDDAVLQVAARRIGGLIAQNRPIDERIVSARNRLLQLRG